MFNIQPTLIFILQKAIVVIISIAGTFIALDIVYASDQSYIYASDLIQSQRDINSEQEIWQYQHEIPVTFQDNDNPYQTQYTYLPPIQKVGSNPFFHPQHKDQFSLNKDDF